MLEFLNQPSPLNIDYPKRTKQAFFVGLFIFTFFIIFKPFGLINVAIGNLVKISLFFGFVSLVIGLFNGVLIPFIFQSFFNEFKWNIKKNILWGLWNMFSVTTIIYFSNFLLYNFHTITFKGYFTTLFYVMVLGFPMAIIINIINQNYQLKKHIKISDSINNNINIKKPLPSEKFLEFEIDKFRKAQFLIDKLIYIEALGNYMNVVYDSDGIKKIVTRETFRNIEQMIGESKEIYRPHRSFLINLRYFEKTTGDSQGLKIHLKNIESVIPVSRSKTNEFRQLVAGK
jgi:hypothetical protein